MWWCFVGEGLLFSLALGAPVPNEQATQQRSLIQGCQTTVVCLQQWDVPVSQPCRIEVNKPKCVHLHDKLRSSSRGAVPHIRFCLSSSTPVPIRFRSLSNHISIHSQDIWIGHVLVWNECSSFSLFLYTIGYTCWCALCILQSPFRCWSLYFVWIVHL
jgi:hypothetical protein